MNDHQHHPTQDLLIARALGELDEFEESERAGVEAHLAECPRCAGVVRTLADAMSGYRESTRQEAPARILVDLIEAQAATLEATEGIRQAAEASHDEAAASRTARGAAYPGVLTTPRSLFQRWVLSLAPPVVVAALLLVLFLTGFWAGRRSVPEPIAPAAPTHSPVTSSTDARVATVIRHPLPDPPRIPFQPALSESR
jgi:anti-sigma factor RsiW